MRRPSKYRNIKTFVWGLGFDRKKEMERYKELLILERAGKIFSLRQYPKYLLQAGFRNNQGKKILPISCKWDFIYIENDTQVVEDVKSPVTRKETAYVIRKKLFMKRYPTIVFREV